MNNANNANIYNLAVIDTFLSQSGNLPPNVKAALGGLKAEMGIGTASTAKPKRVIKRRAKSTVAPKAHGKRGDKKVEQLHAAAA